MRPLVPWTALLVAGIVVGIGACSGDDGPTDPDPERGSLRATVTADGDPFAAVTVELFADGGAVALSSAATAANGQVTFTELDAGAYDVEVVVPAGFELGSGQTLRRDVVVAADQTATVTFALEEIAVPPTEGQVRVRVMEGAAPVQDVQVSLFTSGGGTPLETLSTAADGRALFAALTPGIYDVEITLPAGFSAAPGDTTRKAVTVTAGTTTDVQFGVQGPAVVQITVGGTSFTPNDVTITPGTTVRWIRTDGSHTVTPTGHTEWTSTALNATTTTFEHTFAGTGTFDYHCIPHEAAGMTGVIRVQN